jgi:ubiquinol-cytochrome c reductase subunit 9
MCSSNLKYVVCPGVFVGTVFAGAFAFGIGFDVGVTRFYDYWNRGVRQWLHECQAVLKSTLSQKQWKDLRHKYAQGDSE